MRNTWVSSHNIRMWNVRSVKKKKFRISIIYDIPAEVYNDIELTFFLFFSRLCWSYWCVVSRYSIVYSNYVKIAGPHTKHRNQCGVKLSVCYCPYLSTVFRKRIETNWNEFILPSVFVDDTSHKYFNNTTDCRMAALIHRPYIFLFAFEFRAIIKKYPFIRMNLFLEILEACAHPITAFICL